jgi:hypothetical protein
MTDRVERPVVPPRDVPARDGNPPSAWREAARALLRVRWVSVGGRAREQSAPGDDYFERATCVSFQMDGVPLTPAEYRQALSNRTGRACRPRSAQRARNHVAILRRIESLLWHGRPLHPRDVIRWYTSIACGISAGAIADGTQSRIERIVSSVNSPRLRFWPAVQEVAALHVSLLADPFVPGFNGIVSRLLLRYHMGRCGLPPVVFDPARDAESFTSVPKLEPRLLELIVQSYDGAENR